MTIVYYPVHLPVHSVYSIVINRPRILKLEGSRSRVLVASQGMTDNGLEDAQVSQFELEAPESRGATRYSSQAEPHGAWCPITLVLFRRHLSHRLDGSWAWTLFKNKVPCVYACVTLCVTVCVLGRNVGGVLRVGDRSYL